MNYKELLNKIFGLRSLCKADKESFKQIEELLGSPTKNFQTIHVAGTNGKGSVSKKLACAYQMMGKKTGLYISPHISCFRERITVNGEFISQQFVVKILTDILKALPNGTKSLSFFDITTLLGLLYFSEQKVDIAIIEAGIGGRHDATNIITPILSVITSISLDHTELLGHTLKEIADEKAGIIKKRVPIIIGPRVPKEYIIPHAQLLQAPLEQVTGDFHCFIEENEAIAKACMQHLYFPIDIQRQSLKAMLPCRMEEHVIAKQQIILDVAHNPDGLAHFLKAVKSRYPTKCLRIVVGLSKSKDLLACTNILAEYGHYFYPVDVPGGYGFSAQELSLHLKKCSCYLTIADAIAQARKETAQTDLLLICGSFFIMAEARRALGLNDICD